MKRSAISSGLLAIAILFCPAQFSIASAQIVEVATTAQPVRLEIRRSAHRVTLFRGETLIRSYPVAVGRPGWETPTGEFRVRQKTKDPAWRHPLTHEIFGPGEPGNELGRYWIGFWSKGDAVIGFHDTPHPETVGKPVSHGCVRMFEKDIAELFRQVRVDTLVTVVP